MDQKRRPILRKIYEILFLLVALSNILFVAFDFTYLTKLPYTHLTFRDLYLRHLPSVAALYDPVKGIEGHRVTVAYLRELDRVREMAKAGNFNSPEWPLLLESMAQKSRDMIDKPPFTEAKAGVLEIIKNKMRKKMKLESAKDSFTLFFSKENLSPDKALLELEDFQQNIRPLLEENYFRWIGEDGEQNDHFYQIDRWFVGFFWLDYLARLIFALFHRRGRAFIISRWYEVFNLYPPHHFYLFRILRLIPFYVRLKDNSLIRGGGIGPKFVRDNAGMIAQEISSLVLLNILDDVQVMLRDTKVDPGMENSIRETLDETDRLLENQIRLLSSQIIPAIVPDIIALTQHGILGAMEPFLLSPVGPAVRVALMQVNSRVREGLTAALAEPAGMAKLQEILTKSSKQAVRELSKPDNLNVLKSNTADLLVELRKQMAKSTGVDR